jgi:hypothetical protein
MTKLFWIVLSLFVVGNAFFVLPLHFSTEALTTSYAVNYKKDSTLLHAVFPDSTIHLQVNMPQEYEKMYKETGFTDFKKSGQSYIMVNVSILHNLDFTALSFPFYKVTNFNGVISFYSIIKIANIPERDSTVLIGNITINGKLTVKGICSPLYARTLVEKELVGIFKKEMNKAEQDINRPAPADTIPVNTKVPEDLLHKHPKAGIKK